AGAVERCHRVLLHSETGRVGLVDQCGGRPPIETRRTGDQGVAGKPIDVRRAGEAAHMERTAVPANSSTNAVRVTGYWSSFSSLHVCSPVSDTCARGSHLPKYTASAPSPSL